MNHLLDSIFGDFVIAGNSKSKLGCGCSINLGVSLPAGGEHHILELGWYLMYRLPLGTNYLSEPAKEQICEYLVKAHILTQNPKKGIQH